MCAGKSILPTSSPQSQQMKSSGAYFAFFNTIAEMFMNKPSLSSKRKGDNRGMVYS